MNHGLLSTSSVNFIYCLYAISYELVSLKYSWMACLVLIEKEVSILDKTRSLLVVVSFLLQFEFKMVLLPFIKILMNSILKIFTYFKEHQCILVQTPTHKHRHKLYIYTCTDIHIYLYT